MTDRRVKRTRRLLKAALVELLSEQAYESVTIRDLTDRADIGYATFFRHYDSVNDLMLEIFTEFIQDLETYTDRTDEGYFEREGTSLFEHVEENRTLYRSIFESHTFSKKFREHFEALVRGHLDDRSKYISSKEVPIDVAAQHMVSSILGLVNWWLMENTPPSVQQMGKIYELLIIKGTWQTLSSANPTNLPWEV
ncbi:MAG: TetR/AcrR family transcriptional regulator [Chloroflexi bacterium]|nr:MAG: TetR/AcrR family transcriptional regulator [Chloroflexota bacterium]MBL1194254.1 TetR/AcrR family transcriptional regulator [Chloroflexota bacterium]NOH11547.1 TetR/AcrR family transcriptional regulator [Chloroflexota bacterium]